MQNSASEYRAIAVTRNIYDKLEALGECKHLLLNTGPSLLPETYSLTPEEDISMGVPSTVTIIMWRCAVTL